MENPLWNKIQQVFQISGGVVSIPYRFAEVAVQPAWYLYDNFIKQYFVDVLSLYGIVFPNQNCCRALARKCYKRPYIPKKMIQSLIMQKMEIPGLVTGIGLILGTIVLLVYTIQ